LDEPPLVGRVPLEQQLSFEHRTDPGGRLLKEDEHPRAVLRARPSDESGMRLLEPQDRYAVNGSPVAACAGGFAVEHAPRDSSRATRRGRLTDMCHAVDAVQVAIRPEGDLRDRSQCEKEAQLEVEGELGWESHQGRV